MGQGPYVPGTSQSLPKYFIYLLATFTLTSGRSKFFQKYIKNLAWKRTASSVVWVSIATGLHQLRSARGQDVSLKRTRLRSRLLTELNQCSPVTTTVETCLFLSKNTHSNLLVRIYSIAVTR